MTAAAELLPHHNVLMHQGHFGLVVLEVSRKEKSPIKTD